MGGSSEMAPMSRITKPFVAVEVAIQLDNARRGPAATSA